MCGRGHKRSRPGPLEQLNAFVSCEKQRSGLVSFVIATLDHIFAHMTKISLNITHIFLEITRSDVACVSRFGFVDSVLFVCRSRRVKSTATTRSSWAVLFVSFLCFTWLGLFVRSSSRLFVFCFVLFRYVSFCFVCLDCFGLFCLLFACLVWFVCLLVCLFVFVCLFFIMLYRLVFYFCVCICGCKVMEAIKLYGSLNLQFLLQAAGPAHPHQRPSTDTGWHV